MDSLKLLVALGRLGALHNVRCGFACNSSSSHSIVVLPPDTFLPDDSGDGWIDGYGWEDFCLASSTEKLRYLATMIQSSPTASLIGDVLDLSNVADYVDHNSHIHFPPDREFMQDVVKLFSHPRVAVLGGNDNGGDSQYRSFDQVEIFDYFGWNRDWTLRKDSRDGQEWWVCFDGNSGTKLRMTLDPELIWSTAKSVPTDEWERDELPGHPESKLMRGFAPVKAGTPELVDLKVTDRCTANCPMCYMGSLKNGKQADVRRVNKILEALAELQVFEVAFGGGEPTLWSHFPEVVQKTRDLGITPNVTTKNYHWPARKRDTFELLGGIALSVHDASDLERVIPIVKAIKPDGYKNPRPQVQLQMIPQVTDPATLTAALKFVGSTPHVGLTLLGFKTTGFGGEYPIDTTRSPADWMPLVKEHLRYQGVAIDTLLAGQCQEELDGDNVPEWSYHTEEGKWSMFIDAVEGRMGPSSYEPDRMIDLDTSGTAKRVAKRIMEGFEQW